MLAETAAPSVTAEAAEDDAPHAHFLLLPEAGSGQREAASQPLPYLGFAAVVVAGRLVAEGKVEIAG